MNTDNGLYAIDLFAGAGGLSLGLTTGGFTVVAAVDNDAIASTTYSRNIGQHIIHAPIQDVSPEDLLRRAGLSSGEVTLLAGGPPCQGFSVQRRGDRNDPRNSLILQFIRFVEVIRPRFFLIENVAGLLSKHGKPFLNRVIEHTGNIGYVCHTATLDASEFGVPQVRKRAVIVGEYLLPGEMPKFKFPYAVTSENKITVREAIGNLPSPPVDGTCHPEYANHFREAKLSKLNLERIRYVPEGGGRQHIPLHLQLKCHRENPGHRHLDVYGRMKWDSPSGTITARFDSFTRGRFAHPTEDRSITPREGARLQTFPDTFIFEGNREEVARQIGNAVPPKLAECLAAAIIDAIVVGHEQTVNY